MNRFRIRRCNGNTDAWLLCKIRADGSERNSFGTYTTAMSLGSLLKYAPEGLQPKTEDVVQFVTDAQFLGVFLEVEVLKERLARVETALNNASGAIPLLRV